jgi:phosphonate transport system permease protein
VFPTRRTSTLFRFIALTLLTALALAGAARILPSFDSFSLSSLKSFVQILFPPTVRNADFFFGAAVETLNLAISGTFLGFVAALSASILIFEFRPALLRLVSIPTWVTRGVPDVVFAVLLVQVFGVGPTAGMLALALGTFGVSGKLILDSLQTRNTAVELALTASGMGKNHFTIAVLLPMLFKDLLSQFLLRLEVNFRIAIVLGLVGGGGLGLLLDRSLGLMDYQSATSVVIAITGFIFLTELLSRTVRLAIQKSSRSLIASWLPVSLLIALTTWPCYYIATSFTSASLRFSQEQGVRLLSAVLSPDFASQSDSLIQGLIQSISLSAFASFLVFPLAVVIGTLSSHVALGKESLSFLFRQVFALIRSIPIAVLAVLLVIPMGFGPQTAFIALVIGGGLFVGRIIADALDASSSILIQTISDSGAGVWQRAIVVLAQNQRRLLRIWYFTLDFLFRYSVILGILGSGGIGTVISNALRVQDLQTVAAATILIILVIWLIEFSQSLLSEKNDKNSIS